MQFQVGCRIIQKTVDILSLESIRSSLIRQEETIIFAVIERAQFRENPTVYQAGKFVDLGFIKSDDGKDTDEKLSFLEYMLIGTVSNCDSVIRC